MPKDDLPSKFRAWVNDHKAKYYESLNQRDFGKEIGISQSQVSRLKDEERAGDANLSTLEAMAAKLEVKPSRLLKAIELGQQLPPNPERDDR